MTSKTVLVTGGAKRIGAEISRKFHSENYNVVLGFQNSEEEAHQIVNELNRIRHTSAVAKKGDLSKPEEIDSFFRECQATFGPIDCLINNASVFFPTKLENVSAEQLREIFDVNLMAPIILSKNLASQKVNATIINILDIYAKKPLENYLTYSVSKAALLATTKSLARELGPRIRVNGIAPGAILWPESEENRVFFDEEVVAQIQLP